MRGTVFSSLPVEFGYIAVHFYIDIRRVIRYPLTLRCRKGLKGNPVRIGSGPAAVTGDETRRRPLFDRSRMGRRGD